MSVLANSHRKQNTPHIERWTLKHTTPLEIWDVLIEDRTLWDWQADSSYPEVLLTALEQIRTGTAISQSKGPILRAAIGYQDLCITGGRSQSSAIRSKFLSAKFSSSPVFGACEGALKHWENAMVIDVGQTQIKIAYQQQRITVPRKFGTLPIGEPSDYDALLDFITSNLPIATPQNAILALPCYIHPDLTLGGSSYTSIKGNTNLLSDIAKSYPSATWRILNDAELATLSFTSNQTSKTLVLTLGFGVGACLINAHA